MYHLHSTRTCMCKELLDRIYVCTCMCMYASNTYICMKMCTYHGYLCHMYVCMYIEHNLFKTRIVLIHTYMYICTFVTFAMYTCTILMGIYNDIVMSVYMHLYV